MIPAIAALSLGAGVTVKARTARLTIIACGVHAAYMASLRGWHAHALIAYAPPLPCLVSKPHGFMRSHITACATAILHGYRKRRPRPLPHTARCEHVCAVRVYKFPYRNRSVRH